MRLQQLRKQQAGDDDDDDDDDDAIAGHVYVYVCGARDQMREINAFIPIPSFPFTLCNDLPLICGAWLCCFLSHLYGKRPKEEVGVYLTTKDRV